MIFRDSPIVNDADDADDADNVDDAAVDAADDVIDPRPSSRMTACRACGDSSAGNRNKTYSHCRKEEDNKKRHLLCAMTVLDSVC